MISSQVHSFIIRRIEGLREEGITHFVTGFVCHSDRNIENNI